MSPRWRAMTPVSSCRTPGPGVHVTTIPTLSAVMPAAILSPTQGPDRYGRERQRARALGHLAEQAHAAPAGRHRVGQDFSRGAVDGVQEAAAGIHRQCGGTLRTTGH